MAFKNDIQAVFNHSEDGRITKEDLISYFNDLQGEEINIDTVAFLADCGITIQHQTEKRMFNLLKEIQENYKATFSDPKDLEMVTALIDAVGNYLAVSSGLSKKPEQTVSDNSVHTTTKIEMIQRLLKQKEILARQETEYLGQPLKDSIVYLPSLAGQPKRNLLAEMGSMLEKIKTPYFFVNWLPEDTIVVLPSYQSAYQDMVGTTDSDLRQARSEFQMKIIKIE